MYIHLYIHKLYILTGSMNKEVLCVKLLIVSINLIYFLTEIKTLKKTILNIFICVIVYFKLLDKNITKFHNRKIKKTIN